MGVCPDFIEYFELLTKTRDHCWRLSLYHVRKFHLGPLPFEELDEQWLERFKLYLSNIMKSSSAGTVFSKVKAALRIAEKEKLISHNPAIFVSSPKRQFTHRTFLLQNDIEKLITAPCNNKEVRRAFFFSCYTGLRLSDVRQLRWKNIVNDQIHFIQQKTKGVEYLPLSAVAIRLLGIRGDPEALIFKLPLSHGPIWIVMKKWGIAANLGRPLSFNVSRHTFATMLITKGADIYTVSKLLGHTDIKHTQIYARIIDEKKNQAVNLLPALNF